MVRLIDRVLDGTVNGIGGWGSASSAECSSDMSTTKTLILLRVVVPPSESPVLCEGPFGAQPRQLPEWMDG